MEISSDIKKQVLAQYTGRKTIFNKLQLKDLTSISEKDCIKIYDICFKDTSDDEFKIKTGKSISKFLNGFFTLSSISEYHHNINIRAVLLCFQYLQSEGYDLPQYLLGGKTLEEYGLANYKK